MAFTYFNSVDETIGKTPIIKLQSVSDQVHSNVYAKFESYNPGHSAKDRIALYIIDKAERDGRLKPGGTIIECTSGNTGRALAMVGGHRGYKCIFTVPNKISEEKKRILVALGAEVHVCPSSVKPEDPRSYYSQAQFFADSIPNSYFVNQYYNMDNVDAHYHLTGPEIWDQTNGEITHFLACSGSGGTLSGTSKFLKERNPNIKIIGIDAYGSVLKKYFEEGVFDKSIIKPYALEGVGKNIIPKTFITDYLDQMVQVKDQLAIKRAIKLTAEEGLMIGPSGGAAIQGVFEIRKDLKPTDQILIIVPDHGSLYLSKLYDDEWMNENVYHKPKKNKYGLPSYHRMKKLLNGIYESYKQ